MGVERLEMLLSIFKKIYRFFFKPKTNLLPQNTDFKLDIDKEEFWGYKEVIGAIKNSEKLITDYTISDIQNVYTGGLCHELALFLVDLDRDRFILCECASIYDYDNTKLHRYFPAHWFVYDLLIDKYIDVYGEYDTPEQVIAEWDELKDDDSLIFVMHTEEWPKRLDDMLPLTGGVKKHG